MLASVWFALVGCESPDSTEANPSDTATATPYPDPLDPWSVTPEWTVDEAIDAVTKAAHLNVPNPLEIEPVYLSMLDYGDDWCPGAVDDQIIDSDSTHTGCVSEFGYTFRGSTVYSHTTTEDQNGSLESMELSGGFLIQDKSGVGIEGEGVAMWQGATGPAGYMWGSTFSGTWTIQSLPGCTQAGATGIVTTLGAVSPDGDWSLSMDGVLECDGLVADYEALSWGADPCPEGPSGAIAVRDASGLWGSFELGASCDGCGTFAWDNEETSTEACLDLAAPMEHQASSLSGAP
jgi:hypothetical protein